MSDFNLFKEIRLSEFNEKAHATHLTEAEIEPSWFENSLSVMGPIFTFTDGKNSGVLAYEHGSQYPDRFLEYQLHPDKSVRLKAVKANYLTNQEISIGKPFSTIWFELGGVDSNMKTLSDSYRTFILKYMTPNSESRKPYLFYNTWGRQEKVKWRGNTYLSTMNLNYTLKEIDRARELSLEVYVIDAGWFLKTGDWQVNTALFPDTLKQIKAKLSGYGMKLGLWFNPITAAVSSNMLKKNIENRISMNGNFGEAVEIWETEKSVGLCLVSTYWEDLANRLIEVVKETGVSYFKWDAIGQYGCNDPGHYHGNESNTAEERSNSYAYLLPIYMEKVIEKVTKYCPEAIFDFDITEDGRSVGLQFLSRGKYFIMNNGPYFHNFDISETWKSTTADGNPNILVNPGAARGWFTRTVLDYDQWIPSILFLTHYYPYGPHYSQMQNIASAILGQNGLWGEINSLNNDEVQIINNQFNYYKQVRNDMQISALSTVGKPGDSYEIYEKISTQTGRGAVVFFANSKGEYAYITKAKVDSNVLVPEGITLRFDAENHAIIAAKCESKDAKIIWFGITK